MSIREDARQVAIKLYGQTGSIFGRVAFVTRPEQDKMCRLSFMREDVRIFSLAPNLGLPLGDNIQYLHDLERVKFENLADALDGWRQYTPKWDVLPLAAQEFWSCLVPDILLELRAQHNTITVGGWNLANEVRLNLDAVTGVEVSCRSEALSLALAMEYRRMAVANFPNAINEKAEDLRYLPFYCGKVVHFDCL